MFDQISNYFIRSDSGLSLLYSYNLELVLLSYIVASAGSALVLYIASEYSNIGNQRTKTVIKLVGAISFGTSVWSMHFIGMLAYSLCTTVSYDAWLTMLSILPAICAGYFALGWMTTNRSTPWELFIGGIILGSGIGIMHYSGMIAMQMSAVLKFDLVDFGLSIVAAVLLASVSLWVRCFLSRYSSLSGIKLNIIGGLIMGLAISAMHYIGMNSARFIGTAEFDAPVPAEDQTTLLLVVVLVVIAMLGYTFSGVLFERLQSRLTEMRLKEAELGLIIDHSQDGVVKIDAEGRIVRINQSFGSVFKISQQDAVGRALSDFLPHWDDTQVSQLGFNDLTGISSKGEEIPVRITVTSLEVESLSVSVAFILDISGFKEVEERLEYQSNHDPMTGLSNRRHLMVKLRDELSRCQRYPAPLSLLMLDIDWFKKVNDNFGHDVGDEVIKMVAKILRIHSREVDVVARYGGEEFVIVLPETSLTHAVGVAEKLRAEVEQTALGLSQSDSIKITLSCGVSTVEKGQLKAQDDLIKEADSALYKAKELGRNRVEMFVA